MGIVISTNDGAIVDANDAFLAMVGYTRSELLGGEIDWRALTPPEWLALDERAIAELARTGRFEQYEKEYVRKDGGRVPVSLGGARIAHTDDEQICYIVDLSRMRRAEAALRHSESRFRALVDGNVIGIFTVRPSDRAILEANDEFVRMIGYTRDEFVAGAIRWTDLSPPEWDELSERAERDGRERGRFLP
jgi:PAS domain S-box-containing protein